MVNLHVTTYFDFFISYYLIFSENLSSFPQSKEKLRKYRLKHTIFKQYIENSIILLRNSFISFFIELTSISFVQLPIYYINFLNKK